MSTIGTFRRRVGRFISAARDVNEILRQSPENRRYLTAAYDDRVPVADHHATALVPENPRLRELKERYAKLDVPATRHVQWGDRATDFINDYLTYFRGDTPYVWHYRDAPRVTRLKYFIFMQYVLGRDTRDLLEKLKETGEFGCWHFEYPGYPVVSRDLLDSVNEILFLDRQLDVFNFDNLRVLDIGAGYGRLAHRMLTALPNIAEYCCVDAVPESTFLCEYYLSYLGLNSRGRVVPLDEFDSQLAPGAFDLAVNIHSFSECTLEAVTWWMGEVSRLEIPWLLIVPNHSEKLLTNEGKGVRQDFYPVLEAAGYQLSHREAVFDDPAVRELIDIHDRFFLFELKSAK